MSTIQETEDRATAVQAASTELVQPGNSRVGRLPHRHYEREMLEQIVHGIVPDVDLDSVPNSTKALLEKNAEIHGVGPPGSPSKKFKSDVKKHTVAIAPVVEMVSERADLKGLPILLGGDCKASAGASANMACYASKVRELILPNSRRSQSLGSVGDIDALERSLLERNRKKVVGLEAQEQPDAAPALVQVLQAEEVPLRLLLVRLLSRIEGPSASAALAWRAIFDFSEDVREAAVQALQDRPIDSYRLVLLKAFRYPWPPIADHAADVLVAVRDRDSVAALVDLLDLPDPKAPFQDQQQQWVVRELVRVNHLRNCLLCHAPSFNSRDPVRGLIPTPGVPISPQYYQSMHGSFVRADITYLRQDFSLKLPVADPGKWPVMQRFDYLIRLRALSDEDVSFVKRDDRRSDYPQRNAVLSALRGLTEEDLGDDSAAWKELVKRPR